MFAFRDALPGRDLENVRVTSIDEFIHRLLDFAVPAGLLALSGVFYGLIGVGLWSVLGR